MPQLMNSDDVRRALRRISHEIIERHRGAEEVALIGIHTRGVLLARSLQESIEDFDGSRVPVGELDVTGYRDDRDGVDPLESEKTDISFGLTGKKIVLVDDVLYTGRTVRAALDALAELGRAASIELAVLIDRGHRELPIRPDYIGKNVPTATKERISVHMTQIDGDEGVWLDRVLS